jgi:hypothetical protein
MGICALCGTTIPLGVGICPHHITTDENWAVANRVFCDFLHRGVQPARIAVPLDIFDEALELMTEN